MRVTIPIRPIDPINRALMEAAQRVTIDFCDPPVGCTYANIWWDGKEYAVGVRELAHLGHLASFCSPVLSTDLEVPIGDEEP